MSASVASLAGHSAFETAALAAVQLCGVAASGNAAVVETHRRALVAALERIAEAGVDAPWLRWWLASLSDDLLWVIEWSTDSHGLIRVLGELLALDAAVVADRRAA